jgi:ketosteroid isomerase-like protein
MRRLLSALAVLLAFNGSASNAQTVDENNVLAANDAFDKAISARDVPAMEKLWVNAPYVVVIHPSSTAPVVGWESVKKTFVDQPARYAEFKVVLTEPKVHVLSPTSAYVTGIESFEAKRTKREMATFSANTINVYEKRGDQWLLVTHQATPIRKP